MFKFWFSQIYFMKCFISAQQSCLPLFIPLFESCVWILILPATAVNVTPLDSCAYVALLKFLIVSSFLFAPFRCCHSRSLASISPHLTVCCFGFFHFEKQAILAPLTVRTTFFWFAASHRRLKQRVVRITIFTPRLYEGNHFSLASYKSWAFRAVWSLGFCLQGLPSLSK